MLLVLRIVILMAFVAISYAEIKARDICIVKGRVINEKSEPIKKAIIALDSPNGWEYAVESDVKGNFIAEVPCNKKKYYLTTSFPLLPNTMVLFLPPFYPLRKYDPFYQGKAISFSKKRNLLDVGDVYARVFYVGAELILVNEIERQFFDNKEKWENVWLRIFNIKGNLVFDGNLSAEDIKNNIKTDASSLLIALPEGTWTIEIFPEGRKGRFIAKKTISVPRASSPLKVNLIVRTGKYQQTSK